MIRVFGIAALALASGFGFGLASGASASDGSKAADAKTPVSCLLALESGWKAMNGVADGTDHRAEFDVAYAECLRAN